jgi:hypothetical protein
MRVTLRLEKIVGQYEDLRTRLDAIENDDVATRALAVEGLLALGIEPPADVVTEILEARLSYELMAVDKSERGKPLPESVEKNLESLREWTVGGCSELLKSIVESKIEGRKVKKERKMPSAALAHKEKKAKVEKTLLPKSQPISAYMVELFKSKDLLPGAPAEAVIEHAVNLVRTKYPDSRFGENPDMHFKWYRARYLAGKLPGQTEGGQYSIDERMRTRRGKTQAAEPKRPSSKSTGPTLVEAATVASNDSKHARERPSRSKAAVGARKRPSRSKAAVAAREANTDRPARKRPSRAKAK